MRIWQEENGGECTATAFTFKRRKDTIFRILFIYVIYDMLYMRLPGKSAAFPLTTADFCVILYFEDKSREHTVQRGIGWCKISGEARGYHLAEENGGSRDGSYKCYTNEVKARVEPCGFFSHPGQTHESPSALCICLSGAFCFLGEFYGGIAYVYRYFSRKTSIL